MILPFALLSPTVFAQPGTGTLRVSTAGLNGGSCGSAASPCRAIQHAVNLATSGDRILVEAGTYVYDPLLSDSCPISNDVVCVAEIELEIVGGFAGGDWDTSNPAANLTIIDGQSAYRGLLATDNSPAAPLTTLTMSGLTFDNGFIMGATSGPDSATFAFGGGMSVVGAQVMLSQLSFEDNQAIGGTTSTVGGTGAGGGLAIRNAPSGTSITDLEFRRNKGIGGGGVTGGGIGRAGGLFISNSTVTGSDLLLINNRGMGGNSPGAGAGIVRGDALGGGATFGGGSVVTLTGITATDNKALAGDNATFGGRAFGGGLYGEIGTLTFEDVDLRRNESIGGDATNGGLGAGGGFMMAGDTNLNLRRALVIDNEAMGGNGSTGNRGAAGGGGGYCDNQGATTPTILIENTIIAENRVSVGTGNINSGGGGGLFFGGSFDVDVVHTTLSGNELLATNALSGLGIVLVPGGGVTADIDFTIFDDHHHNKAAALDVLSGTTANLDRGLFSNNDEDTDGTGTINGLGTMASGAAAFVSPGMPNFDYHLQSSSAAVDAAIGSTTTNDFDDETRAGLRDVGADEIATLIFSDGFESGNTTAWSSETP